MDYSGKVKVMKKTLAALFAILCVAGGMRTAATTTNANTKNSGIVITASAADTEVITEGKNASKYTYKYADATIYSTSFQALTIPVEELNEKTTSSWEDKETSKIYKTDTKWTDSKTGNSYSIYKITIKENKGNKSTVSTEYRIGLATLKPTTIDFKLTDDIAYPVDEKEVKAYLSEKNKDFTGISSKKATIIGPSALASSYVKTVDFTGFDFIGDSALKDCKYITEVTIPKEIKYIGTGAFENSGLKKLYVNNEMPVVPEKFCSGTNLTEIKFAHPDYIRTISKEAFKGTPLSDAVVTNADYKGDANYEFVEIGDSAFENCANIKTLAFPANVITLGKSTFKNNTALTTLKFGENLIAADNSCFYGCTSLNSITWNNALETLAGSCFTGCTSLKTISGMPTTLKDWKPEDETLGWGVGDGVFSGCTSLEHVILPTSLTRIPGSMFEGDIKLKSVQFGDAKKEIDSKLTVASGDNIVKIKKNAFANCELLQKVDFGKTTYIEEKAFLNCKGMTSFNVGECSVVGTSALEGCSALKEITLLSDQYGGTAPNVKSPKDPNKTNSSEGYVFKGCTSAKKITIKTDDKVKLSSGMFQNCTSLTDIGGDLSKIEIIGKDCFSGCTALTHLNMPILKIIESSAFANCTALKQITDDPTLPIKATDYGDKAFQNCSELKFTLTGDISTIGASAFQNSGVTSLSLNGMVGGTVVIGNSAFADCANLKSAVINSQDAKKFSVGTGVFTNCPILEKASYDGPLVTASMFKNCPKLNDIKLLADVINANAFEGCSSIQSLINKNDGTLLIAKEIDGAAFKGCSALINSSADANTIFKGSQQYSGCAALKSANVSTLTPGMFENCTSLNSVKTNNVTSVPAGAFQNCTSLDTFVFTNIESIGANAFANTGFKSIELPANVASIGNNAFLNCAKATSASIANKNATITGRAFGYNANKQIPNFIISGIAGSTAETYAKNNKLNFMDETGKLTANEVTTTTKATTTKATTTTTKATTKATTTTTKATTKASSTTTKAGTTTTTAKVEGVLGDTNGDGTIDVSDAVLIMQSLSNPSKFGTQGTDAHHITEAGKNRGDVENRGNGLTNMDALAIQKYKLELIKSLPESVQK